MTVIKMQALRLSVRLVLLAALLVFCVTDDAGVTESLYAGPGGGVNIISFLWLVLMLEILARFLPLRHESAGSQKHMRSRHLRPPEPPELDDARRLAAQSRPGRGAALIAAAWLALNSVVAALYFYGLIDEGGLLLTASIYSVCDIVCILFFCPFRVFFMKNRCCVDCGIFNWDCFMLTTPLLFIKSFFTWSLCLAAIALLVKWEFAYRRRPERFSERTNEALKCKNCTERLCRYQVTRLFDRGKKPRLR